MVVTFFKSSILDSTQKYVQQYSFEALQLRPDGQIVAFMKTRLLKAGVQSKAIIPSSDRILAGE